MKHFVIAAMTWALASSASAGIIFSEDFEDGAADGWSLSGLWKVTLNAPATGAFALGYVQSETAGSTPDGNYNTGATTVGTALTPLIQCAAGPCIVSFDWFDISEASASYDVFDVLLIRPSLSDQTLLDNGNSSTYLSFSQDIGTTVGADPFSIAFVFDSVDGISNSNPGVRVDNFQVGDGRQASVPSPATLALFGLGLAGLGWSRRKKA